MVLPSGQQFSRQAWVNPSAAARQLREKAFFIRILLFRGQSEQLRAGANYHLLGTMRRIEERDRERFSQPPNEEIPNP